MGGSPEAALGQRTAGLRGRPTPTSVLGAPLITAGALVLLFLAWRALPGPTWLRAAVTVLVVLLVVAAPSLWVFPAVAALAPVDDGTVG